MWACQNVERVSENILKRVLAAKDGHARSAGARMIRYWHDKLSDPVGMIATASADPFPRTRMEAVLSAGYIPRAESFVAALHSLDHPGDPVLDQALPQTMKALEQYWRPAMDAGKLQFAKPAHREFAEQGSRDWPGESPGGVSEGESPADKDIATIQAQLLEVGTDTEVRMIVSALSKGEGLKSPAATIGMLETLQRMARPDSPRSLKRSFRGLKPLISQKNESIAVLAASTLGPGELPVAMRLPHCRAIPTVLRSSKLWRWHSPQPAAHAMKKHSQNLLRRGTTLKLAMPLWQDSPRPI